MCVSCHAEVNIVQVVYTHRVKQFQDESNGDPSALLIPALLDSKVSFFSTLVLDPHSQPLSSNPGLKPHHQHLSSTPVLNPISIPVLNLLNPFVPPPPPAFSNPVPLPSTLSIPLHMCTTLVFSTRHVYLNFGLNLHLHICVCSCQQQPAACVGSR